MNPDERIRMINYNAHKNDTHRVQNSDAGVGFGTLIGDRDYFAQQIENWFDYHAIGVVIEGCTQLATEQTNRPGSE